MISPPRRHTACSPKVIIANLLHRARMPWILKHPCDSWLWDVPKNHTLAAQPRAAWALAALFLHFWITTKKANSGWECGQQRFALDWSYVCWDKRTLQCDWRKHVHPKASASRFPFVIRACHGSHHDRTTIPDNTPCDWNWIFGQRVKGYWYGSY